MLYFIEYDQAFAPFQYLAIGRGKQFMIESAVKRMNERAMYSAGEAFNIENVTTLDLDNDGEPDLDITHWSLAQLKTFFKLNNFDDTGFSTREEYVDYLSNPPA